VTISGAPSSERYAVGQSITRTASAWVVHLAAADQTIGGQAHAFRSWSDGGAAHDVNTPAVDTTYTTTFSG